jgi:hypothetical protein
MAFEAFRINRIKSLAALFAIKTYSPPERALPAGVFPFNFRVHGPASSV